MPALLLSALPYIIGAAMVMGAVYSAKEYVSTHWATKAGIAEGESNIQPKLDQCTGELTAANDAAKAVKAQNDALDALKAEATRKQAAAATALAGATQRARTWEDNAARLRSVLTAPRKAGEAAPTSCDAAWVEIRKPAK